VTNGLLSRVYPEIEAAGPIEAIQEDAEPPEIALAVEKLLISTTHEHPTFGQRKKGRMTLPPRPRRSQACSGGESNARTTRDS
jgi:hypothetical protein